MSNKTIQPTEKQKAKLAVLKQNFGLSDSDISRCLWFAQDQEIPYVPPELLIRIARQTGEFQSIDPEYSTYVNALEQIIYKATVVDTDGRAITRIGVATIGERPGGYEIDPHKLAEGRALGAVLSDAGFNPFKTHFGAKLLVGTITEKIEYSGPYFDREKLEEDLNKQRTDEAAQRTKDLRHIHALAQEKNLIFKQPSGYQVDTPYRDWLSTNFKTRTAAILDAVERAQVINALRQIDNDYLMNVPTELHADATIA